MPCSVTKRLLLPRTSEDSVDYIGRVHGGIEVIEYPGRVERSILICAGTGLMLSMMDECPRLRWCVDVDGLDAAQLAKLTDWMRCINNVVDLIVVAGWYSSTNPVPLAMAVRRVRWERLLVYVQCHGPGDDPFEDMRTAHSVEALSAQVKAFSSSPSLQDSAGRVARASLR